MSTCCAIIPENDHISPGSYVFGEEILSGLFSLLELIAELNDSVVGIT